jgi:hypothetical protein
MNPRQFKIVLSLAAAILLGANLFAWATFERARSDAADSLRDAETCRKLAAQITSLRTQPMMADNSQKAVEELAARVQLSAQSLGIDSHNIASIAPDSPARLADSPYLEQATTVQLREVTLPQLVKLLCNLSGNRSGLRIKALHLSIPPQQAAGNIWSAEITVSSLIYSPMTSPGATSGKM